MSNLSQMTTTTPSSQTQAPRVRITAHTILELGSELISADVLVFYQADQKGFAAEANLAKCSTEECPSCREDLRRATMRFKHPCRVKRFCQSKR